MTLTLIGAHEATLPCSFMGGRGASWGEMGSRRGQQSGGKMAKDEFRGATLKGLVAACLQRKGAAQRVERATCFV